MFSAIKKAFGKEEEAGQEANISKKSESSRNSGLANASSSGIQQMDASLQRRFARGIQYNMKIIIRGDRNTGKSSLFQRLKGQNFGEDYIPTEEIQVGSINWSYKTTDDVVKVEVWDVVDRGKRKKKSTSLKIANAPSLPSDAEEAVLDAEWVDVYKGTHGVVMTTDVTKPWTLDYVRKELVNVPPKIPVLILANFRDLGSSRVLGKTDYDCLVEEANMCRGEGAAEVRSAESSMKTAFGLKFLHRFFNIPFLVLQRESLERQMETNHREMSITRRELDALVDSEEQNYEVFCENTSRRKPEPADGTPIKEVTTPTRGGFPADGVLSSTSAVTPPSPPSPEPPSLLTSPSPLSPTTTTTTLPEKRKSRDLSGDQLESTPRSGNRSLSSSTRHSSSSKKTTSPQPTPRATPTATSIATPIVNGDLDATPTFGQSGSFFPVVATRNVNAESTTPSKVVGGIEKTSPSKGSSSSSPAAVSPRSSKSPSPGFNGQFISNSTDLSIPLKCDRGGISSVDDFVVDEAIENSFLEDFGGGGAGVGDPTAAAMTTPRNYEESDSDEDANPMVAAFQEDLNPEDLSLNSPNSNMHRQQHQPRQRQQQQQQQQQPVLRNVTISPQISYDDDDDDDDDDDGNDDDDDDEEIDPQIKRISQRLKSSVSLEKTTTTSKLSPNYSPASTPISTSLQRPTLSSSSPPTISSTSAVAYPPTPPALPTLPTSTTTGYVTNSDLPPIPVVVVNDSQRVPSSDVEALVGSEGEAKTARVEDVDDLEDWLEADDDPTPSDMATRGAPKPVREELESEGETPAPLALTSPLAAAAAAASSQAAAASSSSASSVPSSAPLAPSSAPLAPPSLHHPIISSLTLDDFNFLETQSGVSSADGEIEKKTEVGTSMLTPSSSLCDISESSDHSAETKKKTKKKKKEVEEDGVDQQKAHKKKKKHKEKEEEESGGKKKHKSSKKTNKKATKEEQQAMEFLGATAGGSVGGEYESI